MSGSFAEGLVGVVLDGRYRLDAVVGEGGMGSVFRAQHLAMDRRVAVKLLKPHLTADHTALQRFAREARATLKVDSPHAVKVLDFGVTPRGDYYMALEYLDGRTVQKELDVDGPFAPLRVLHIGRQALHALGAAHRSGLVHRDIKPDNILLMRLGEDPDYTKLLDFGVAKLMQGSEVSAQSNLKLTQAGMVFGTPEFMSPEQACGHPLDGRSDLYSLAATLFAMLTGCGLFHGKTPIEWLTHHARTPPPHLESLVPELAAFPELDALMQRCLAKHREQRPSTAEELEQELARLETYVQRGGGAAASSPGKAGFRVEMSASSYFQALPLDMVEAGETRLAAVEPALPVDTGVAPIVAPRRGGLYLALGAVAVLAVLAIAIGGAASRRSRSASMATDAAEVATAANTARGSATIDAGAHDGGTAIALLDAGAAMARADAGTPPNGRHRLPARNLEAALHLKNAEAAVRSGNRLGQLAEADLALKSDPRNVRAKYLLADALIQGGDL
ncbi:MAG: serine/threonine protein kinase, partial [Deltaproteobacteria bacterium]|nr:serine/threonine protein kinase [Deltaproteobacteria bacterium]